MNSSNSSVQSPESLKHGAFKGVEAHTGVLRTVGVKADLGVVSTVCVAEICDIGVSHILVAVWDVDGIAQVSDIDIGAMGVSGSIVICDMEGITEMHEMEVDATGVILLRQVPCSAAVCGVDVVAPQIEEPLVDFGVSCTVEDTGGDG